MKTNKKAGKTIPLTSRTAKPKRPPVRQGIIRMSNDIYQNNWKQIYMMFSEFRPAYIEFRHWDNNTWYFYGQSEHFEAIQEGQSLPFYVVSFIKNEDETVTMKFIKA